MQRSRVSLLLGLTGCLLGRDPYKDAYVPEVKEIRLVEPSASAEDGNVYARQGTLVVVDVQTELPVIVGAPGEGAGAPGASYVTLGGFELTLVEQRDDTTWRFSRVLDGSEQSSPKTVSGELVNAFGGRAAFSSEEVLLYTDFIPPTAACVLSPRVANTLNPPQLTVTPSERLAGGAPLVVASVPEVLIGPPRLLEGQIFFDLEGQPGFNTEDYVLTVTGADLAGNPQVGDSFCDPQARTGTLLARGPAVPAGAEVTLSATPSVIAEELVEGQTLQVPRARVGAVVVVEIPTVDPIDPARSSVALSGLELDHLGGNTWGRTLVGTEGEGLKTLDAFLVDAADNTLQVRRAGVARFDFTPPSADCVLQPKGARADDVVRFDVFASEQLAGGVPVVSSDHPNVAVSHLGSTGTQHSYDVSLLEPGNADYVLTVEATDLVGNPPGAPLCDPSQRTGTLRGVPPALAGAPVLTAQPSVQVDEAGTMVPRVRAGALLAVALPTVDSLDHAATQVNLSGTPLPWDEELGAFATTLDGSEGDGLKTLDARLVDPAGNETRQTWPGVIRFDFTPPFADCVLVPSNANAQDVVVLQVFASEALEGGAPDVISLDADVGVSAVDSSGTQHTVTVDLLASVDVDFYELRVTATDLVGNPQAGDSLCDLADRSGSIKGIPPALDPADPWAIEADPAVDVAGVDWVRAGALLTVSLSPLDALDEAATRVSLSGLELDPVGDDTWMVTLTGTEGDGLKDLRLHLVDMAGNVTDEVHPGVIRFDFTPPVADCVIQPVLANGTDTVTFDVFASEPLAAAPTVISSEPGVSVGPATTTGNQHRYVLTGTPGQDLAYTLSVTGADRAGNPQVEGSLCDAGRRAGEIRARGPALTLAGEPVVSGTPSVATGGAPLVRAGALVTVTFGTVDPIDPLASSVSLSGIELEVQPDGSWQAVLEGDEGDGLKDLRLRLVDAAGNVKVEERRGVLRLDFTPPVADCVLQPALANSTDTVTFDVFASEALGAPPAVSSTNERVTASLLTSTGNQHRFVVTRSTVDQNESYELIVTAADLVGNPQEAGSLCPDASTRRGQIVGRGPVLVGLSLDATPSIEVGGVPWVRDEAVVSVTFTTAEPLDPTTTTVTLSGLQLDWVAGQTWATEELTGDEVDGPKSLDATLRDAVGNGLRVTRPDVVRFDFTPPAVASAVLERSPFFAPADDGSGRVFFNRTDLFTGAPVSASLRITATEDLGARPVLGFSGPASPAWSVAEERLQLTRWTLSELPFPDGEYGFTVVLEDALGNRSAPLDPGVTLAMDTVGPTVGPDVDAAGLITATRAPWGTQATGGQARLEVQGGAGSVLAGATVVVLDDTGVRGQARADGAGAFRGLRVSGDLPGILVAQLDDAGNPSPPVTLREASWTATLGGKLPGLAFPNPHTLTASRKAPAGRPPQAEVAAPGEVGPGGEGVRSRAEGAWIDRSPSVDVSSGRTRHTMALDPIRQQLVLFGGRDDGGNAKDDTWIWDGAAWIDAAPAGDVPRPRDDHAMAYDPSGQQLVLFGGYGAGSYGDTWGWDGTAWKELSPVGDAPSPRFGPAMAYDPIRQQLVLFGGYDGTRRNDTWVWDGTTWSEVSPGGDAPFPRSNHTLAFDPVREQILCFGGLMSGALRADVWAWDGTDWTEITPAGPAPAARYNHTMVLDPVRQQLLLVGGTLDGLGARRDVWAWDGAGWNELTPAGSAPLLRSGHAMAVDPVHQQLVLFGGAGSLRDTWTWDGAAWTDIPPAGAPPPARAGHVTAFDPVRQQVVLFGGRTGSVFGPRLADTWAWDGTRWTEVSPAGGAPSARYGAAVALDPVLQRLVLFGGRTGSTLGDTWVWDGSAWTDVSPAGGAPSPRYAHAMALDPIEEQLVLFGGSPASSIGGETWAWEGADWTRLVPPGDTPPPRYSHAMAFDAVQEELVLFGGLGTTAAPRGDTWVWDGTGWTDLSSTGGGPSAREAHAMVFDPVRQQVILFGGSNGPNLGDTWAWDGAGWIDVSPTSDAPPLRRDHRMAYDPVREQIVLFGGEDRSTLGDTWVWESDVQARPTHQLSVAWRAANVPSSAATRLTARWRAGGVGYPDGADAPGATLQVWDTDRWVDLDTHTARPSAPTELCWTVRADSAVSVPDDCSVTTDPLLLRRLFVDVPEALHFRVVPSARSGTGIPGDRNRQYGELSSTYVEVSVGYRLAAP